MASCERNYDFIDGQNMHKGTVRQGWRIDYGKLMAYLRNTHQVVKAYIFLGRVRENEFLYRKMERKGFIVIFKEVSFGSQGIIKAQIIYTVSNTIQNEKAP
ncbi:MAG: hypothetical protein P4L61_03990 [Candidatus Pacebacteria bacterium]|nr:hypothetical protein [Candidatus Paceibacterota bacterium]